ncbi:MAG: hypothetical protein H6R25_3791 [Proteobacteria bacterium]|nr:hypothetical protein [Pseudomonadota bacterium]
MRVKIISDQRMLNYGIKCDLGWITLYLIVGIFTPR